MSMSLMSSIMTPCRFKGAQSAIQSISNAEETLELGQTTLTKAEVASLLEKMLDELLGAIWCTWLPGTSSLIAMCPRYPGSSYHLIRCNCNHFASDLCRRLGMAFAAFALLENASGLVEWHTVGVMKYCHNIATALLKLIFSTI